MPETVSSQGRVITFYSYKGGTGRSMAMANVSWLLALSGFKVLVIDWDLEAPGLHRYFRPFLEDADLAESEGIIDFVTHFVEAASEQTEQAEPDWYIPYSNLLPYAKELDYDFPGEGTLDFIPAGRQSGAYAARVNSFNWKHFYEKLNGGHVLDEVRRILKEEYDYILIDSRTGVSDTAGICTVQMPDDLVVAFTLNLQSVLGASAAAASVVEQRVQLSKPIRVFPVPMRVEPNEKLKTETMKAFAKPRFVPLLPTEMSDDQKDKYWAESNVPYIPFYAYEENLAYFRDELNSTDTVLSAMTRIANRLTPSPIGELPKLDAAVRTRAVAAYDAFSGTRTASLESQQPKTAVYLCIDKSSPATALQSDIAQNPAFDLLSRERFEKTRSAAFLVAIGPSGLTASQTEELTLALRPPGSLVYTVLLPGAQPESLPRLLLPFDVIDLRSGGKFALPDPAAGAPPNRLPLSPYPGLNPFTANDGPVFVARGGLLAQLADAVARSKFVALVGPRRSGKTSLVQAGLIPALTVPNPSTQAWEIRFGWPGAPSGSSASQTGVRTLLIVNANDLAAASTTSLPDNTCVLAIAETAEQAALCAQKLGEKPQVIEVPPLSDSELRDAIIDPAVRAGLDIEFGLALRIVADLKNEPAQLPLLQYLMSELYDAEPRGVLNVQKYERMGGVAMVERKCESILAASGLSPSSLSRFVLVAQGPGGITMEIQAALDVSLKSEELAAIGAFVAAGVIVRQGDSLRFRNRIFLDRWPHLRQWIKQDAGFLLWRQRLDQSLAAWHTNARALTLLSGDALAEAQKQAAARPGDLNAQELAYIDASATNAQTELLHRSEASKSANLAWVRTLLAGLCAAVALIYYFWPKDQGFPTQGWCYQAAAPTGAFKAYCYDLQQDCDSSASKATGAGNCALMQKLDLQSWGGTRPSQGTARGSWRRLNLPAPLPSPFPQPQASPTK